MKFDKLEIREQKEVEIGPDIHGIRFDIYATDEKGRMIVIEMQVLNRGGLPKRVRYYQAMADMQLLEKNIPYERLQDSYVIMIAPFDLFKKGRYVYTFTKRCHEVAGLELGDGTNIIVLNARGTKGRISKKLKNFLEYVSGKTAEDDFVKMLDLSVVQAQKSKEWRKEYMTWMQTKLELMEMGREEGLEEGREEGREYVNSLNRWLMEQGRNDDLIRSFNDPDFQEELLKEMHEQEKAGVPV
ncbi:MAG: Rpn family recombination-promoting nuclease/putative transposase [Lachnospiraceae bacterium]|nr:Rpn family recombination-promoting nuclease/putative transposase [Lachnospiraceae bacterium]